MESINPESILSKRDYISEFKVRKINKMSYFLFDYIKNIILLYFLLFLSFSY